jgi:hypothetical protein
MADTDLALVSTEELFHELASRHSGQGRSCVILSLLPLDGAPGKADVRIICAFKDLAAAHVLVSEAVPRANVILRSCIEEALGPEEDQP